MRCIVEGEFFSVTTKKTNKGNEYFELRLTQENDLGINTEVFLLFDTEIVKELWRKQRGDIVYLLCDIYLKNEFLQKRVIKVLDLKIVDNVSGEILSA